MIKFPDYEVFEIAHNGPVVQRAEYTYREDPVRCGHCGEYMHVCKCHTAMPIPRHPPWCSCGQCEDEMRERDIQAKVVGHARAHRVICRKLDFGEGWPDYMMLFNGRIMFMEFKGAGGRTSPLQDHVFSVLRRAEFTVHVVNAVEVGLALVDNFTNAQPDKGVVDYSDIIKKTVENRK